MDGIDWDIVGRSIVIVVLAIIVGLILWETHRLRDMRRASKAIVDAAMEDIDEEYKRLVDAA